MVWLPTGNDFYVLPSCLLFTTQAKIPKFTSYFTTRDELPIKNRDIKYFKYDLPIKHKGLYMDTDFIFYWVTFSTEKLTSAALFFFGLKTSVELCISLGELAVLPQMLTLKENDAEILLLIILKRRLGMVFSSESNHKNRCLRVTKKCNFLSWDKLSYSHNVVIY